MRRRTIATPSPNTALQKSTDGRLSGSLSTASRGRQAEAAVHRDLLKRGFEVLVQNHWFGRSFEVDLWVQKEPFGEIWIEVKTMPAGPFAPSRWHGRQRRKALRAAESLGIAMWLAFVNVKNEVIYIDGISQERVDLKT